MIRNRYFAAFAALSAAIGGLACANVDSGARDSVVREDSAGVEIVVSPQTDRPLNWTLQEVVRLGGAPDGPASFTGVGSYNLGADADGNLYVMDDNASRIVVFGPDGDHLRSMGSEGGGPGELQFPLGLSVTPGGVAVVFDIGKGGLVPFGPDGTPLPQVPFPFTTNPGVRHFQKTDDGVAVTRSLRLGDRRGLELVAFSDRESTSDTVTFAHQEFDSPAMVDFGCMGLALRPLFAPSIRWAAAGGLVATVTTSDYRIDLFTSDGRHVRSVRRDLPPREATMADAIAEAEPGMRMQGAQSCEVTGTEVAEGRGFEETTPAIREVLLQEDGGLWVERFEPGTRAAGRSGPVDIFDASGAYLGSLAAGTRFPILLLPDDRIALSQKDDLDVERLVVMTVTR